MAKRKKSRDVSLDELDPFDLDATPENADLVRRGLAKLDKKRLVWSGVLAAIEGRLSPINASATMAGTGTMTATAQVIRSPRGVHRPLPKQPTGPLNLIQGSMADVVYRILSDAGRPISYEELKNEISKTALADKINDIDRPHYGAVQRLKEKGYCVTHNGRIATPENLKKFLEEVAAGRAVDIVVRRMRNRWADAVVAFLDTRPEGATSREIYEHLRAIPEFKEGTRNYHNSYVFTLLSKMHRKLKMLERDNQGRYRPVIGNGAAYASADGHQLDAEDIEAAKEASVVH
jgi:hypothetical protein